MREELYRYILEEYPAELRATKKYWFNKNMESSADPVKLFLKWRRWDIEFTSWLYIGLIFSCILQMLLFLSPLLINKGIRVQCPVVLIKAIFTIMGCMSFIAWRKQLWLNKEYYARALGNYSKYEPIYVTLRLLNE